MKTDGYKANFGYLSPSRIIFRQPVSLGPALARLAFWVFLYPDEADLAICWAVGLARAEKKRNGPT